MKKELFRKSFHTLFGVVFLLLIWFAGVQLSTIIIGVCLLVGMAVSLLILKGYKVPLFFNIVKSVERKHEKHFPGKAAILFFASALILLVLFRTEPTLILAALSVEVFADSAAAIVGRAIGKHKLLNKKTWEGTITCFIVALACLLFFYATPIALIAALAATVIEVLPGEDNLWVPIGTGIVLKILTSIVL